VLPPHVPSRVSGSVETESVYPWATTDSSRH